MPRGHQLVRTNASGEYSGRQAPEAWAHFGRAGYEPFLTRVSSHSPTEGGSPGALLTLLLPAPRALLASVPDSSDLMQWVSAWRSVLPGLAIDDFRGVRHGEIGAAELDYVEHLHALGLDLPAWRRFLKLSPDGRWGIDAWLYNIGNRGGHVSLERGPDTTVGLVEVETGKCRRLLSGGPALEVQVVSWIGPHTVALGGRSEDPRTSSPHLALWVYDAEARTAVSYRGPECTPAEAASVTWDPER
ncbi:MAG: hypothetical protein KC591_06775 [Gemmatimonadetes bacterium]|nr:hypothetical protein [Gemmatimonadota bacterium]